MGWKGTVCGVAALGALLGFSPAIAAMGSNPDFGTESASADTRFVAQWAVRSGDHRDLPFAIVDKREARLYLFDSKGRLSGTSPVLLGQALGDNSAPDVGEHAQAGKVPVDERTTPAGRFPSQPGRNLNGELVVWVDYRAALAIHRLRPGANRAAREARLASATPLDKRASLGCIVVPEAFYDKLVLPALGSSRGMVYVLPETIPVEEVFGAV